MNAHKRRKMKIYNMVFGNKEKTEQAGQEEVVAEAVQSVQEVTVEQPAIEAIQVEEVKTTTKKKKSST
jgi:hypothetical protein